MFTFSTVKICSTEEQSKQIISYHKAVPCTHCIILMIYADIVEFQVIGQALAPILCIINVTENNNEMVLVKYDRPYYLAFSCKSFNFSEIVVRIHFVGLISFECELSHVNSHFRQKYLYSFSVSIVLNLLKIIKSKSQKVV